MKRILITGGLGYIGGRLAVYLKKQFPDVDIILTTRKQLSSIPDWAQHYSVRHLDMACSEKFDGVVEDVDTIIHLAAANEIVSSENPQLAHAINVEGTDKLLATAKRNSVGKFIYFSTFHVYTATPGDLIDENSSTNPEHPYAKTHLDAENLVIKCAGESNIKTCVLRLSNSYGYPMDPFVDRWSLLCNDLCRQAVKTGVLKLRSNGMQHRDFISMTDVTKAVAHLLRLPDCEFNKNIFNLGGECSMTVRSMAYRIAELYGKKYQCPALEIQIPEGDSGNVELPPVKYSIEKLKRIGFELTGNRDDELLKTFEVAGEAIE